MSAGSPESAPARELEVGPEHEGTRLDAFLTAALPDRSRSQIQKLIKDGLVTGAGKAIRASTPVRAGQRFSVEIAAPEPSTAVAEDLPLTILYEDADVVVIDKPAGMVVHPGAGHNRGTVVNALLGSRRAPQIRFGHPSGVMVVGAETSQRADKWIVTKVLMSRSARRLMEGTVFIPSDADAGSA